MPPPRENKRKSNNKEGSEDKDFFDNFKRTLEQHEANKEAKRRDIDLKHAARVDSLQASLDAISINGSADLAPEMMDFRNQRKIKLQRLRDLIAKKNAIEAEIAKHVSEYETAYTTTCREVGVVLDARLKAANKE